MAWDDGHRRYSAPLRDVISRVEKPGRRSVQIPVDVEVLTPAACAAAAAPPSAQQLGHHGQAASFCPAETAALPKEELPPHLKEPAPARPVRPRARTLSPPKPQGSSPKILLPAAALAGPAAGVADHTPTYIQRKSPQASKASLNQKAMLLRCFPQPSWDDHVTGPPPQRTPASCSSSFQPPLVAITSPRRESTATTMVTSASTASSTTTSSSRHNPATPGGCCSPISAPCPPPTAPVGPDGHWVPYTTSFANSGAPAPGGRPAWPPPAAAVLSGLPSLNTPQPPQRQVRPAWRAPHSQSSGTLAGKTWGEGSFMPAAAQPWWPEHEGEPEGCFVSSVHIGSKCYKQPQQRSVEATVLPAAKPVAGRVTTRLSITSRLSDDGRRSRRLSTGTEAAPRRSKAPGSCSPARASKGGPVTGPGSWALSTVDEGLAARICCLRQPEELGSLDLPFSNEPPAVPSRLGSWMIWMVHRVAINDPKLRVLDFSRYQMPLAAHEPRIAPKLIRALASNTHLRELHLVDSNLQGGEQANALAEALAQNQALRVLSVGCNLLEPADLKALFGALARNATLEVLKCSDQFCSDQAGWDGYQALAEALKTNRTLRKVGLELTDAHWRDQINRGLIRNIEAARKRRWEEAQQAAAQAAATAEQEDFPSCKAPHDLGAAIIPDKLAAGCTHHRELNEMAAAWHTVARMMADAGGA